MLSLSVHVPRRSLGDAKALPWVLLAGGLAGALVGGIGPDPGRREATVVELEHQVFVGEEGEAPAGEATAAHTAPALLHLAPAVQQEDARLTRGLEEGSTRVIVVGKAFVEAHLQEDVHRPS